MLLKKVFKNDFSNFPATLLTTPQKLYLDKILLHALVTFGKTKYYTHVLQFYPRPDIKSLPARAHYNRDITVKQFRSTYWKFMTVLKVIVPVHADDTINNVFDFNRQRTSTTAYHTTQQQHFHHVVYYLSWDATFSTLQICNNIIRNHSTTDVNSLTKKSRFFWIISWQMQRRKEDVMLSYLTPFKCVMHCLFQLFSRPPP